MATKSLKQLLARPLDRAPIVTITGEQGVGKTTLAALFPKPVVIRTEDGLEAIPEKIRPYAFPIAHSLESCMAYVQQLIEEDNPFQTLVVDSVTQLGSIIEREIIASDVRKPKSLNQALGGYGAGASAAAARHRLFADKCLELNALGVAIVFVAHSTVDTIEPPDADPFTRYGLRLDKKCTQPYLDLPDAVAFVRLKTRYITKEDSDRTRAVADKTRVIVLHPTGAHVSKNRYGIEAPVEWADKTRNPLLSLIPFYASQRKSK